MPETPSPMPSGPDAPDCGDSAPRDPAVSDAGSGSPNPKPGVIDQRDVFFQCRRCTNCCRWPGEVKVGDEEIRRIAELMDLPEAEFIQDFTRLRQDRQGLALIDKPNGECFFLRGNDCSIQDAKPVQCQGFPNTWNFPGWRRRCEAQPFWRTAEGGLKPMRPEDQAQLERQLHEDEA